MDLLWIASFGCIHVGTKWCSHVDWTNANGGYISLSSKESVNITNGRIKVKPEGLPKNMRTSVQIVLGIMFLLAFETFKLGMNNAPYSVLRKLCAVLIRGSSFIHTALNVGTQKQHSSLLIIHRYINNYTNGSNKFLNILWMGIAPESMLRPYKNNNNNNDGGSVWVWPSSPPDDDDDDGGGGITREPAIIVHLKGAMDQTAFAYRLARRTGYRVLLLSYPLDAPSSQEQGQFIAAELNKLWDQDSQRRIILSAVSGGAPAALEALVVLRDSKAGGVVSGATFISPLVVKGDEHGVSSPTPVDRHVPLNVGLPPLYIQASAEDPLQNHAQLLHEQCNQDTTQLETIPYGPHSIALYSDLVGSEATTALNALGDWMRDNVVKAQGQE